MYSALKFQSGSKLSLNSVKINGVTYVPDDGYILVHIDTLDIWSTDVENSVALPSNNKGYFYIEGNWKSRSQYSVKSYYPLNLKIIEGKLYNIRFSEDKGYLGFNKDGEPNYLFNEIVDLGLSVKWLSNYLGANSVYDSGFLFAWGETTLTRANLTNGYNYYWETAPYYVGKAKGWVNTYTYSKYSTLDLQSSTGKADGKTVLDLSDDAAYVNLGGPWRMPTKEEFKELIGLKYKRCIIDGFNGFKLISKSEGTKNNSIFFCYTSMRYKDHESKLEYTEFWTSSLFVQTKEGYTPDCSYAGAGQIPNGGILYDGISYDYRFSGLPIRPVCPY